MMTAWSGRGKRQRFMRVGAALVVLLQSFSPAIASAAVVGVTPVNLSILSGSTGYSDVDAGGYETLKLSFEYNAEKLEVGDTFFYGWKTDTDQEELGSVAGIAESIADPTTDTDETGSVTHLDLPDTLANSQFQIYFQNTGVSSGTNDQVDISGVSVSGEVINTPPTEPTASPPAGIYNSSQMVMLSSNDDSGVEPTIRYTLDGSVPDQTSPEYADPIPVTASMTIKAIAYDILNEASEIATFSYVIDTDNPIIQDVQYSNNDAPTNGKVKVTVIANESIKTPSGWSSGENDKTVTKEYDNNTTEFLKVEDLAGNESAEREINVKGIDTTPPAIIINGTTEDGVLYTSPVTYEASDNVAVSTITINGVAASSPDGGVNTSGIYDIIVTDTAGNPHPVSIEVAIPVVMPTLPAQPSLTLEPLSPRSLVSTPTVDTSSEVASSSSPETTVQADTVQASNPDVIDSPGKDVALAPSEEGWKLWGIAWYWYGAVASLAGSGWWLFGRKYFTAGSDDF